LYGKWCRLPGSITKVGRKRIRIFQAFRQKPDIFNRTRKLYNEIKPFSIGGVAGAVFQMGKYAVFGESGYSPDSTFRPRPYRRGNVWFFNVQGVIFYTDLKRKHVRIPVLLPDARKSLSESKSMEFSYVTPVAFKNGVVAAITVASTAALLRLMMANVILIRM